MGKKKELEFMSAVTEMAGQANVKENCRTKATDTDATFVNLILSQVRQLPTDENHFTNLHC